MQNNKETFEAFFERAVKENAATPIYSNNSMTFQVSSYEFEGYAGTITERTHFPVGFSAGNVVEYHSVPGSFTFKTAEHLQKIFGGEIQEEPYEEGFYFIHFKDDFRAACYYLWACQEPLKKVGEGWEAENLLNLYELNFKNFTL